MNTSFRFATLSSLLSLKGDDLIGVGILVPLSFEDFESLLSNWFENKLCKYILAGSEKPDYMQNTQLI